MADGVFNNTDEIGNAIKQSLMMRYQQQQQGQQRGLAQQNQQRMFAQQTALANLRANYGLAGHLSLTRNGQPGSPSDYLDLGQGIRSQGVQAAPVPIVGAGIRAEAQGNAADTAAASRVKAAGIGAKARTDAAALAAGGKQKTANAKTSLDSLKAQEKTAKDEATTAFNKIKANTVYSAADHQALVDKAEALSAIRRQMSALTGAGGQATPDQWNQKWSALTAGQSLVGLDGKTYTKR